MTGLLSPLHLALVLVVLALIAGSRRLPALGRSAGTAIRGLLGARGTTDRPEDTPAGLPADASTSAGAALSTRARPAAAALSRPSQRWLVRVLIRLLPRPYTWLARLFLR